MQDRSLTQITFGTGPDFSPMPDPGGKGIYYVNGKSSGFLTAYHIHSKESTDIVSEDASQPVISPDGKRVMYIMLFAPKRTELWVSDIDGGNKVKNRHRRRPADRIIGRRIIFTCLLMSQAPTRGAKLTSSVLMVAVFVNSHGWEITPINSVWSPDQKSVYVSGMEKHAGSMETVWKWNVDGSNPEKVVDNCCEAWAADPGGHYLLGVVTEGGKTGIYEVSTSDRKCIPLLPGVATETAIFARDGKSFLYSVASRGEVTIYRQSWKDGKTIGAPQVALKVPFAFPVEYDEGNAYDFSRDLSTIVYVRPGGHADLYLLSQK